MLVGSRQRTKGMNLTITLNGTVLKHVKCLGVYLDQHLTWQSHVDYVLEGNFMPLIELSRSTLQLCVCFTRRIFYQF